MRSAKEADNFPYAMSTVCYFEVYKDGKISQIKHKNKSDLPELYEAYKRALNKITTIYAVWPGNWRSDLFIIDDLKKFINSFNI